MTLAEKLTIISANTQKIYNSAIAAEYNRFWNAYQLDGKRTNYMYAFAGICWTDNAYNPKYTITHKGTATSNLFNANNVITDTKVTIDVSGGNLQMGFNGCVNLKTVPLIICDEDTKWDSAFANCKKLEYIRFDGVIGKSVSFSASTLLTAESIYNIFSHLGGTATCTLTLPSVAPTTYNAVYGEGAFEARVNARPSNWTIAY